MLKSGRSRESIDVTSEVEDIAKLYESPCLLLSLNELENSYIHLSNALPGVGLYYAIKANSCDQIVQKLYELGCNFDVSTNAECKLLEDLNVPASKAIHTHPVKSESEIEYAIKFGVQEFTVDNICELQKFEKVKDKVLINVRISIDNDDCRINLSRKFGASYDKAKSILDYIAQHDYALKGFSFHVGSQSRNSEKYIEGIEESLKLIKYGSELGLLVQQIDIGGGFPVTYIEQVESINSFCSPINDYIKENCQGLKIIAEPGRFLVADSMKLLTSVKGISLRNGYYWYYLDDGIYQSFSGKVFDLCDYSFRVNRKGETYPSILAGPTCDSGDIIKQEIALPLLELGDSLLFNSMGAYCSASASSFNGYSPSPIYLID